MTIHVQTASRGRRRPGFGGWRPFFYQLTSYSAVALPGALLSVALVNGIVFYGGMGGVRALIMAAAATALAALIATYLLTSGLMFHSAALFKGQLSGRFLLVNLGGAAVNVGVFAAVAYALLRDSGSDPNAVATVAEGAALAAAYVVTFLGLRLWVYMPDSMRMEERPLLAAGGWMPVANLDPELASIVAGERVLRVARRPSLWLLTGLFLGLLALGWYGLYRMDFIHADALARSANAYHVIFSRDPHLAAIGLFWPPLPSLLQVPLMPLLKPFGAILFAGVLVSTAFAVGLAAVMYRFTTLLGVTGVLRMLLVAGGLLNPLVLYYMVSGATEVPFLFFVMGAAYFLIGTDRKNTLSLLLPGVLTAGAVLTRYEGLAAAAGIAIAAAFIRGPQEDEGWSARLNRMFIVSVPPAAAFGFWLFAQWQIQGDPLYFVHTSFSGLNFPDTAEVAGEAHPFYAGVGSILEAVRLAVVRMLNVSVAFGVAAAGLAILALLRRDRIALILLLAAGAVPAFHAFQIYTGRIGPYTRYWIDFAPWAVPMFAYLLARTSALRRPTVHAPLALIAVVLLLVSAVTAARWMYAPPLELVRYDYNEVYAANYFLPGGDAQTTSMAKEAVKRPRTSQDVVEFMETNYPTETILVDQWFGHPIIIQLKDPTRVVMTNDSDFFKILDDPVGRVDIMMIARPDGVSPHVIEDAYPGIWKDGRPWLTLEAEVGKPDDETGDVPWRIYRVRRDVPDSVPSALFR